LGVVARRHLERKKEVEERQVRRTGCQNELSAAEEKRASQLKRLPYITGILTEIPRIPKLKLDSVG
jgi:hypothetical protein